MGKLNTFLKWLVNHGHIQKNPLNNIARPKVEYTDKRFLDGSKVEKIFNSVAHEITWANSFVASRNITIFKTLLYTGIRRGELINLRLTDVDLSQRSLFINGKTSKSRKNRHILIHPHLVNTLDTYIQARSRKNLQSPYLFTSSTRDKQLTLDGLKHLVEKVRDKSNVKFHLHQWRHTFAMNLLNQGTDIAKLRQLMGHADIAMTAVYLRQIPQRALKGDIDSINFHDML